MEDFYATYGRNLNLDKYVRLAARACNRPSAILHLLGDKDQHTLAHYGTPSHVGYCMNRRDSICDFTGNLHTGELLSIKDTLADERVNMLSAVIGPPYYRWYLGTPIRSADDELIGALCVLDRSEDATEATDEMKASMIDLAECISTELALRADCNMALRAKKDFLTSVSHELRDPMHGINMGLELLTTSRSDASEEKFALDTVRKCSQSLEGLVDKILCITDKDQFDQSNPSVLNVVNLAETVETVLNNVWKQRREIGTDSMDNLQPIVDIQPDLVTKEFLLDRRTLMQIVQQLFSNATKFTRSGTILVRLELQACTRINCSLRDVQHDLLYLSVKDSGCGMSASFLAQAAEQFSQEDPLRGGVGLGLSVVRKLVNQAHGELLMSSKVDSGSLVEVKICIDRADSSTTAASVHDNHLSHKKFSISPTVSTELANSVKAYFAYFGMVKTDSPKDADCVLGTIPGFDAKRTILIGNPPPESQQQDWLLATSDAGQTITVSLPLGPVKLQQALLNMFTGNDFIPLNDAIKSVTLDSSPTEERNHRRPSSSTSPMTPMGSPRINHHNHTCLIVDDNPINVKILSAFLKRRGYLYSCAKDGFEAIQAVKARPNGLPFDVILMDINMPNMNGVEATRLIREYQSKNGIRSSLIVALSGCSDAEQKSAMARGLTDFFKKPVDLQKLTQFMDKALNVE